MTSTCLLTYQEKHLNFIHIFQRENELNVCEYVQLTSDEPWYPDADDWAQQEAKYTRGARNNVRGGQNATSSTFMNSTLEPYTSQIHIVGKTSSGCCR